MASARTMKRATWAKALAAVAAIGLGLLMAGCDLTAAPILAPKGPIALAERNILFRALLIMMVVAVPVFAMTFWFAWRYRASNRKARYERDWESTAVDTVTWIVPALIVTSLGVHVWIYTHALDPYKPLQSSDQAAGNPGRRPGLEMALHLSGAGNRDRQRDRVSKRGSRQPEDHLGHRDEFVLHPGACRANLCHGRHADTAQPARQRPRTLCRQEHPVQRPRLRRPAFRRDCDDAQPTSMPGWRRSGNRRRNSTRQRTRNSSSRAPRIRWLTIRRSRPACSTGSSRNTASC